jgi:hypothetical protein
MIVRRSSVFNPRKNAYRNVALRSHSKPADGRSLVNEKEIILPEAQTGTSTARSRSFQDSRLKYSRFGRIPAILSIRDRRLHCLVLLGAKACFQQDRRSPLPITTRSSPLVCIHNQMFVWPRFVVSHMRGPIAVRSAWNLPPAFVE